MMVLDLSENRQKKNFQHKLIRDILEMFEAVGRINMSSQLIAPDMKRWNVPMWKWSNVNIQRQTFYRQENVTDRERGTGLRESRNELIN